MNVPSMMNKDFKNTGEFGAIFGRIVSKLSGLIIRIHTQIREKGLGTYPDHETEIGIVEREREKEGKI
ncbi:hypothetical protein Hanom_Chr14g01260931 [Helianthus anomalus]